MNFSEKFGQHFYSYLERNFFNHREVLIKQNRCVDLPSPRAHEGQIVCLSDLGEAGVQSMGPDVSERGFADLTDVTLADDDKNPTLLMMIGNPRQCDVAIYATWWPTLQTMQVAPNFETSEVVPLGGQICN